MLLAELECLVPRCLRMRDDVRLRAGGVIERHRIDCKLLIACRLAVRGAPMIADHAQHVLDVLLVSGEGAELLGHFGRSRVSHAGHDRGQPAAQRTAFLGVVGKAHGHQQAADVSEAETERAEFVGQFGDLLRRKLRHHHRNFEHQSPEPAEVFVGIYIELAGGGVVERQQVCGRQIAGGVVEEHVFRARIGGADIAGDLAGVPVVHRGVEVQSGVRRRPGGVADLLPQVAGL